MAVQLDFGVVLERWPELVRGTAATIGLALVISLVGLLTARQPERTQKTVGAAFFIFFALPLAGVRLNPTVTAIIALGLNGGAYAIEIIRGGVEAIPTGQTEAGLALGLRPSEVFRFITE